MFAVTLCALALLTPLPDPDDAPGLPVVVSLGPDGQPDCEQLTTLPTEQTASWWTDLCIYALLYTSDSLPSVGPANWLPSLRRISHELDIVHYSDSAVFGTDFGMEMRWHRACIVEIRDRDLPPSTDLWFLPPVETCTEYLRLNNAFWCYLDNLYTLASERRQDDLADRLRELRSDVDHRNEVWSRISNTQARYIYAMERRRALVNLRDLYPKYYHTKYFPHPVPLEAFVRID